MGDEREFKIRITGDASGIVMAAKQGQGALEGIKSEITDGVNPAMARYGEETKGATAGTEKLEISHRAIRYGLHQIGPEAAEAGHALILAFSNPATAALIAVVMALKALDEIMKSMIEKETSNIGAHSLAAGFADVAQVARDAKVSLDGFFRTLHEGASAEEELGNQTERATALAAAQAEAARGQADAEKEMALAKLELANAEGKLTDAQYKGAKIGIEQAAEMRKLDREKAEREASIKRHREEVQARQNLANEDAAKVPPAREQADSARLALEANERRIKNAKANEKSYAETKPKDMTPALKETREQNKKLLEAFQANQPGLQEAANAAKDALAKLESEAKTAQQKAQAERAKVETEQQVNRVKTAADENNLRTRFEAHRIMAGAKSEEEALATPTGKALQSVATTEQMRAHGQRITAAQQSQETAVLQMLNALGMHGETVVKGFRSMKATTDGITAKIAQVVHQIDTLRAQHRDTYNQ